MRGISEERLRKIARETHDSDDTNMIVLSVFDMLIGECEELNTWKPIDENTPKDHHILLLSEYNVAVEGYFTALDGGCWVDGINYKAIKPKFWQELPPLPKEK